MTASLLSCGLASTLAPAALVAKRQPALVLPSGNQIPHRVIPARRGNAAHSANTSTAASTSSTTTNVRDRRASAPQGERESTVRVRFGSTFGIHHGSFPHWTKSEAVTSPPSPPLTQSLSRQQQAPPSTESKPLALPSSNYANHLLTDLEGVSEYSRVPSNKPKDQVSLPSSSTSSPPSSSSSSPDSDDGTSSSTFKYQRRRSRAVLYHLSGRFDKKNKHNKLNFKSVVKGDSVSEVGAKLALCLVQVYVGKHRRCNYASCLFLFDTVQKLEQPNQFKQQTSNPCFN
ncbi:unnamed protein product [Hydatigera taeniaeformis]|uniref:PID domain-containing protein n=1 Tax=Hydatigena taeniaeformis TaxID=6205 RepID=A0A0R3WYS3_HYDTA|nr:unnamed protein product [Hydatigera taeniaeformis]